jgi:hypothetical protein
MHFELINITGFDGVVTGVVGSVMRDRERETERERDEADRDRDRDRDRETDRDTESRKEEMSTERQRDRLEAYLGAISLRRISPVESRNISTPNIPQPVNVLTASLAIVKALSQIAEEH